MRLSVLFSISALCFSACIEPVEAPLSQAAQSDVAPLVLEDVGAKVILPSLQLFLATADQLSIQLELLADSPSDDVQMRAAQSHWLETARVWQQLELMQLGPAGNSLSVLGGENMRDEIYSWPTINPCLIDQKTVEGQWSSDSYFTENMVNAYGLDALEHLLFAELETVCPSQVSPVSDGAWQALGPDGVRAQRIAFAQFLLEGIMRQAAALHTAWSPEGDNFTALMLGDTDASPYASRDEALYAIYLSLFYLETMTKDRKLALPLGLQECTGECSASVEAFASQSSLAAIEANLVGFKTLFSGGEGMGYDDLLSDLGHADLSDQILTDTEAAIISVRSIESSLSEAIVNQPDQVMVLYDHIGVITDQLKGDLATVLLMTVPAEAAGDND